MGLLIEGKWHTNWYDTKSTQGEFIRPDAQFRNWVTPPGKPGSYQAEKNRYHLYVAMACPWAHRALIMRKLKQLDSVITVSVLKPEMMDNGWEINPNDPGPLKNINYLYQVYQHVNPKYTGRVTIPILWDKYTQQIVNNESADILRLLNHAFNDFTAIKTDYYPPAYQEQIEQLNTQIYHAVNNGVYKTGFATTQDAYEKAFMALFDTLEQLEQRLSTQRFLCGNQITEADWRLFTTLIRFDHVYHGHFKCNKYMIEQFQHLPAYVRDLYQQPGIADTVNFKQIQKHYYYSHQNINPNQIVPLGPNINHHSRHNRQRLSK